MKNKNFFKAALTNCRKLVFLFYPFSKRKENMFLVFGLFFGLTLVFLIPPFQSPDEQSHFFRAWEISEGKLVSNDKCTHKIPSNFNKFSASVALEKIPGQKDKKYNFFKKYREADKYKPSDKYKEKEGCSCTYAPVSYIPQVLAILLGKLFGSSFVKIYYLGRIFNLLGYLILVYLAISIAPYFKNIFLMLGLVPMAISQAASFSSDGMVIGFSFLLIAYGIYLAFSPRVPNITSKNIVVFTILSVIVSLAKVAYFYLFAVFLLVPFKKFSSKKKWLTSFLIVALAGILSLSIWLYLNKDIEVPIYATSSEIWNQLNFILSHPLSYLYTFLHFTFIFNFVFYLQGIYGILGILDHPLPLYLASFYVLFIVILSFKDFGQFKESVKTTQKKDLLYFLFLILLFIGGLFIVSTIIYLTWSSKQKIGLQKIAGMQPRYLLPIAPFLFIAFSFLRNFFNNHTKKIIISTLIFSLLSTGYLTYKKYYARKLQIKITPLSSLENSQKTISPNDNFEQTFLSPQKNLNGVRLFLENYKADKNEYYKFILKDAECQTTIREIKITTAHVKNKKGNLLLDITFNPIEDSFSRKYCFLIAPMEKKKSNNKDLFTLKLSQPNLYNEGDLFINGNKNEADIVFNLLYYTFPL